MTDPKDAEDKKLVDRDVPLVVAAPRESSSIREAVLAASRRGTPLVIIGTSGSTDFLRGAGDRRFWPVRVSPEPSPVAANEDADADEGACDGIHDEGAPAHHLCSRCFPDVVERSLRGDLAQPHGDESDEDRRDDDQEME